MVNACVQRYSNNKWRDYLAVHSKSDVAEVIDIIRIDEPDIKLRVLYR